MILLRSSFIHRVLKAFILTFRCMKWPKSPPINVMGFNQIIQQTTGTVVGVFVVVISI